MIPLPLLRRAGGKIIVSEGIISFVAASNTVYVDSGTALNVTIPASVEDGDALVAFIFHRSALTPAAGWTVVDSQVFQGGSPTTTQYLSACIRTAEIGDSSAVTVWTQAATGRIGGHIMCFRGSSGGFEVGDVEKLAVNDVGGNTATIPGAQATKSGQMFLAAASFVQSNAVSVTISASAGWTQTSVGAVANNRLGCAYQPVESASVASGTFIQSLSVTNNGIGSMAIVLVPLAA